MVLLRNIALVALTLGSGVTASNAAYFKRAPEGMLSVVIIAPVALI